MRSQASRTMVVIAAVWCIADLRHVGAETESGSSAIAYRLLQSRDAAAGAYSDGSRGDAFHGRIVVSSRGIPRMSVVERGLVRYVASSCVEPRRAALVTATCRPEHTAESCLRTRPARRMFAQ